MYNNKQKRTLIIVYNKARVHVHLHVDTYMYVHVREDTYDKFHEVNAEYNISLKAEHSDNSNSMQYFASPVQAPAP